MWLGRDGVLGDDDVRAGLDALGNGVPCRRPAGARQPGDRVTTAPLGYAALQPRIAGAARWLAIGLGAAMPVSVAADGVLLAAFALAWLASGDFAAKWGSVRNNPARAGGACPVRAACGGYPLRARARKVAVAQFSKYQDLLLVPMLVSLFAEHRFRQFAVWAFLGGMLVTLALSYLIGLGLFPEGYSAARRADPTVFRLHVTQNFFMAYTAFALACLARSETNKARRGLLYAVAFLALFNVIFMVQGRTGYLVAGTLLMFFLLERTGWRSVVLGTMALALLGQRRVPRLPVVSGCDQSRNRRVFPVACRPASGGFDRLAPRVLLQHGADDS